MSEKKIGTRFFKAGDVLATDAIKLQIRLMKIVGPALETLPAVFAGRAAGATAEEQRASDTAAIKAISSIFDKADPDAMIALIEEVLGLGMISMDGKGHYDAIVLDQEFSGSNAKDLIPVIIFILQETLGDFFTGVLASGSQKTMARA
jgi:hypothetical protein